MTTPIIIIGLMILIASCCFIVMEMFANNTAQSPMPLTDWVYDKVVQKYPKQIGNFTKEESA